MMRSPAARDDLENWENRARVFLHEVTHLDYFIDAPGVVPEIWDLEFPIGRGKSKQTVAAYGPEWAKSLATYAKQGKGGFYTQQNSDTYAWFAVAKWAEKQILHYPPLPPAGPEPVAAPKKVGGGSLNTLGEGEDEASDDDPDGDQAQMPDFSRTSFKTPGCRDRLDAISAEEAEASLQPECDDKNALSGVPVNIFNGTTSTIYDKFCDAVGKVGGEKLAWTVNSRGDQSNPISKRSPPASAINPDFYGTYKFALEFSPVSPRSQCTVPCQAAFAAIAKSPCGHQGGDQNTMTAEASLDVKCGTYSYKITGNDVPKPQAPPAPKLSAQYCFPAESFGSHGDISGWSQGQYSGAACTGAARKTIKRDDPSTNIHYQITTNGVPYNYHITWRKDCESSVSEMNVWKPLGESGSSCTDMLANNYKNCNNGGVGGSVSVGCVLYEFKAKLD